MSVTVPPFRSNVVSVFVVVSTLLLTSFQAVYGDDTLSTTDKPSFHTEGEGIWGPTADEMVKQFRADILNISGNPTFGDIYNGYVDGTTATLEGDVTLGCAAGTFFDVETNACYSCPTGYSHNPLLSADSVGVCFRIGSELRTAVLHDAATFICPTGQFPNADFSACYSCPAGYSHNPLLPVDTAGVCFSSITMRGTQTKQIGCNGAGEFDGLNGSCYVCPSGYNHNIALPYNVSGVCYTSPQLYNDTMHYCGYRSWNSCKTKVLGICFGGWDYHTGSCLSDNIRSGNNYYDCNSGYTHNILVPFNYSGICEKLVPGSNTTANYAHAFWCENGDQNGLDGYCYSCPAGYTNTAGVCNRTDYTTATAQGGSTFVCPSGQFLDVTSGKCASCDTGFAHNPALPASEMGACYERDDKAATYVSSTEFGCPAGSFFDAVSGACYSCPSGYNWNPLAPVTSQGVCYKLDFSPDGTGNFQLGYKMNMNYRARLGVEGSISLDPGSVTVDYNPTVTVTAQRSTGPNGEDMVTIHTAQAPADSSLNMSTTWPQIVMTLDAYLDAATKVTSRMVYPRLNDQGIPEQIDKTVTILDEATNGEAHVANDPMMQLGIGTYGLEMYMLGDKVLDFQPKFDPPIQFKATLVADPDTLISLGYVIFELGAVAPDLRIPTQPDYIGDVTNDVRLTSSASGTYAHSGIQPNDRSGFNFLQMGGTAQDMDFARLGIDVDGWYALATDEPVGIKVVQGLGVPGLNLWQVDGSILNIDLATIFSFREDFNFTPNLDVLLTFSEPTRVETSPGSGNFETITQKWVRLGDDVRFIHPGGQLHIGTTYSLRHNLFTNDTDLIMTPIVAGDVLALTVKLLGMPPQLPNHVAAVHMEQELLPKPVKLVDMNFNGTTQPIAYSLQDFHDQTGGSLDIKGLNQPPVAVCRNGVSIALGNGEPILDENGNVIGTAPIDQVQPEATILDGGSYDPDWGSAPTQQQLDSLKFALNPAVFSCASLGNRNVSMTVTDNAGATDSCTTTIEVLDNNPPVIAMNAPQSGTEGEQLTFSGAGSTDGCGAVVYDWQFSDTDAHSNQATVNHAFCNEGNYTATLAVTDPSGNVSTKQDSIDVSNSAPVVTVTSLPLTINEGSRVELAASYSDAGSDSHTATVAWGDDAKDPVPTNSQRDSSTCGVRGTLDASHVYADDGNETVTVSVNDGTATTNVTRALLVKNVPPTAKLDPPGTVWEGTPFILNASFTDPGTADTHSVTWDFGDGTTLTDPSGTALTVTHQYPDNGPRVVKVTVTDDDGGVGSASVAFDVQNVPPLVSAGEDQTTDEGSQITVAGSFTDPGADTHTYVIDWGDGTPAASGIPTQDKVVGKHVYADNGNYTVTVTVTDDDGGVGSDTLAVKVNNVAPSLADMHDVNIYSGGTVTTDASFTDPGVLDTHTATIDWGDSIGGAMTVQEQQGSGTASASRTYRIPGTYAVTVSVTDKDGATTRAGFKVRVSRLPVLLDIKPDSSINAINPSSNGVIPVAIVSTATAGDGYQPYNAPDTDVATLQFGPAGAAVAQSHPEDVNDDGVMDLLLKFRTRLTGLIAPSTQAVLLGMTTDGRYIVGTDKVSMVPPRTAAAGAKPSSGNNANGKSGKH